MLTLSGRRGEVCAARFNKTRQHPSSGFQWHVAGRCSWYLLLVALTQDTPPEGVPSSSEGLREELCEELVAAVEVEHPDPRHALNVTLCADARLGFDEASVAHGMSITALLDATGHQWRVLASYGLSELEELDPPLAAIVRAARQLDAERRRHGRRRTR